MSNVENLIMLAGEQAAPNLLPARYFQPKQAIILHTSFPRSKLIAENLKLRLSELHPRLELIDDYNVGDIRNQISAILSDLPAPVVNITGGTKPMSIGALEAAKQNQASVCYVRSQGAKTELDLYSFDENMATFISKTLTLTGTIDIDDYLTIYFGNTYQFTGFKSGPGKKFEITIHQALLPNVDEIKTGWKHTSGAVDIDFIIRCNNQIGIIEAKTGKKALSADGIKQLAVAGGQRFFGTYIKRFLVIDRLWDEKTNIRKLAEAIGIVPIELPGFSATGKINNADLEKMLSVIYKELGQPLKKLESAPLP
jgi:hypothetical protein